MLKIVRGKINHSTLGEVSDLISSLGIKLNNYDIVKEFESEFSKKIGTKYAKTMPFARYALYQILKYKDFPQGSEVIMPPITIKPMVDIILMLGLKPIFVDIELDTLCYDEDELKKAINESTKAISITYLFGIVPNIDNLITICKKNNLYVIEDFSHTLNASYNDKKIGTFGDVSIYSSSSLKTVDTYIGGTVFTNDEKLYKYLDDIVDKLPNMPRIFLFKKILLNLIRNIFSKSVVFTFITNPLLYLLKNLNSSIYKKVLGARLNLKPVVTMPIDWTYRFTSLQARRGLKQLKLVDKLDKDKIDNVNLFRKIISTENLIRLPKELLGSKNVYWQYPLCVNNVDKFIEYLKVNNIDMGLTNLSLCSHLDIYPKYIKETPNANKVKIHYLFVPTYQGLSKEKIEYISNVIKNYLEKINDKI
jgi:perosamine synthetase